MCFRWRGLPGIFRGVKRGLIFDLDGTLVDSLPGIAAALNQALEEAGHPVHPLESVRRFIGNGSWVTLKRAAPAGTPDEEISALEQAFKRHYDGLWRQGSVPYEGVPAMLEQLAAAGHRLAVLSNKAHPFAVVMVEALFPEVPFEVVVGQRPGIPHKPDRAGIDEIVAHFNLPPEDFVMVGDSTVDLETARNAGIGAVAVTWGYHDREVLVAAGAARLIDRPGELVEGEI